MKFSSRLSRVIPGSDLAAARAELAGLRREVERARQSEAVAREGERRVRAEHEYRVRNMLAVVRSLFARTVASSETLDDMADHFRGRFDVFARYQSAAGRGSGQDLESIVRDELRNFEFDTRVAIAGPEVRLADDTALLVALAIHELVTNSIKFGALANDDPQARIAVDWSTDAARVTVRWQESGVAVVAPAPIRSGFGREFIEHALPYQLGTESRFALLPGGVTCTFDAPVDP